MVVLAGAAEVPNAGAACSVAALHPALPFHPDVHEQVRALVTGQPAGSCAPATELLLALRQFGAVPNHAG